jgi:hypothetical protein
MDECKEETEEVSAKPLSEGKKEHEGSLLMPHKLGPERVQDERMRQIIAYVALSVWSFCTVVSALRYFMTGQSDILEWLINLVMGAVVAYYFWRQRGNSGFK